MKRKGKKGLIMMYHICAYTTFSSTIVTDGRRLA